jgi:hypothetical protein
VPGIFKEKTPFYRQFGGGKNALVRESIFEVREMWLSGEFVQKDGTSNRSSSRKVISWEKITLAVFSRTQSSGHKLHRYEEISLGRSAMEHSLSIYGG